MDNNERLIREFFRNMNLPVPDTGRPLTESLAGLDPEWLEEFGLTAGEIPALLAEFLETMTHEDGACTVRSLTVVGGHAKNGDPEDIRLRLVPGDVVSIVGPTGSGKSRLLADVECLAQGDTPTGRRILIDDEPVDDEARFALEGRVVAQLSQNMNFVMDLSVSEFLEMHARSRSAQGKDTEAVVRRCFDKALELAGEPFSFDTKVTQLSGGQSRALMIADCAYMSESPIVLVDEIENAGVDRTEAMALLAGAEKIVLISTHDPLLALSADRRVVIRGGAIAAVLERSKSEDSTLTELEHMDEAIREIRTSLRKGERVYLL
ncbi:MAG: ATP-binding cassette domain-containing protein [Clostridiales Family XIII bacterium]|jgi:ABC-type lipoprotein export system ATPase subunit|nr:ATP-binding cassette domain-containing protein [Clostridiales Family XIII bacterium]